MRGKTAEVGAVLRGQVVNKLMPTATLVTADGTVPSLAAFLKQWDRVDAACRSIDRVVLLPEAAKWKSLKM